MSKYLLEVNYTLDGMKGLQERGWLSSYCCGDSFDRKSRWEGRVLLLRLRCNRCLPHRRHA